MVEVRFLQHFAQFAGANGSGQSLFFVFVKVVLVGLAMARMGYGVELLTLDDLFFNMACAGGVGGDGRYRGACRLGRFFFVLFLAEAEEAEVVGGRGSMLCEAEASVRAQTLVRCIGFQLCGCKLVRRFDRRRGFRDETVIEVAAEELGFVLVGFKLRLSAGLFELGFLGLFDVLEFFDAMG